MLRLINYLLLLITLLALLIIIIPFGLSMSSVKNLSDGTLQEVAKSPAGAYWNPGSMIPGPIVLMIACCALLPLQQIFWFKKIKTENQYPVDTKWLEKYKITLWLASFTIAFPFLFFMGIWLSKTGMDKTNVYDAFENKKYVYIAGIVLTCLMGLSTMGYASYVNIMISYEQQKQLIDEGIKNGTYDPVTRRPYDEVKPIESVEKKDESEIKSVMNKENETFEQDIGLGSSGLAS